MLQKCVILFRLALVAVGISAVSIFLIPQIKGQSLLQYILAGVFWVSFVAELVLLTAGNCVRRRIEQRNPQMKQKKGFGKIGAFCFAQNTEAMISDVMLLVSVLFVSTVLALKIDSMWLMLFGILAVYLSLHLHCILNGILYKSIKYYRAVIHKRREQK